MRRHATKRNFTIAASLLVVAVLSFYVGLFYPQIASQSPFNPRPYGLSGLIVDYVTVNGPAINDRAPSGEGFYQSSCCPDSICSGLNGFGVDRLAALNQQNPPEFSCSFRIGANTSGFLWVIVFNTDWDLAYRAMFTTSSSDNTVAFVSMPDCANNCTVGPVTVQWFKLGFAASADHDSSRYVTLSVTVLGFPY
jgi:hypothetical protein